MTRPAIGVTSTSVPLGALLSPWATILLATALSATVFSATLFVVTSPRAGAQPVEPIPTETPTPPEPTPPEPIPTETPTPTPAEAAPALFLLFSEPGELIGQGFASGGPSSGGAQLSDELVRFDSLDEHRIDFTLLNPDSSDTQSRDLFSLSFGTNGVEPLAIGSYTNAREETHPSPAPLLQFERLGSNPASCPASLGMFEILELTTSDGSLMSFSADFQFSCNITGEGPWSMGSIRYNSSYPLDSDAYPDGREIEGKITGPNGFALANVLVCVGVRNQSPADARRGNCVLSAADGTYRVMADLDRTPAGQGYGEFYVHFFPFAQMQFAQECYSGLIGCAEVDFINLSRPVYVSTHIDAELAYGCWDQVATIIADANADQPIYGTEGDDVIVAFGGDDVIFGLGGDDFICPGNGTNRVYAGDGDDEIFGGIGSDELAGQGGDDMIWGNLGNDKIRGGEGNDEITGDYGDDNLSGGRGNDSVDGGYGADTVRGGTGDDVVNGGPDADVLVAGNGGRDLVSGGSGDDLLVTGGPRPDVVEGGPGNDVAVKGLGGADAVYGQDGDDHLYGGAGTDSLDGGNGTDICSGGNGFADRSFDCEQTELATVIE